MEPSPVLSSALAIITLLFVATLTLFALKKSKFPYTVALVLMGLGMGYLAEGVTAFEFLEKFQLSPELVFYVFLPTLIF